MGSLLRDLRNGAVSLWRSPAYSAVAILTLAVGVGASISMFTVMQAVLLRPLPYERPSELVMLWSRYERTGAEKVQVSPPDFLDFRERSTTLTELVAMRNSFDASITGESTGEQINLTLVTANFFEFLGRPPALGRDFTAADQEVRPWTNAPAILSHDLWVRRYGADEGMIGRTIEIIGARREVIGVLSEDFQLILPQHDGGMVGEGAFDDVDVWAPVPSGWMAGNQRGYGMLRVLGRLSPGATLAQARQEMFAIAAALRSEHAIHEKRGVTIDVLPLHTEVTSEVQPMILALFGAVGVVLVIACANVANLALVRGTGRSREVAIRAALGGTRSRIVRELLAESTVLALAGGALGVAIAAAAIDIITALAPADVPRIGDVGMDASALLFALGMSAVALLLSGVVPAFRAASPQLSTALKDGNPTVRHRSGAGRNLIVVAEVALSMVLLVVGALLVQSFARMASAPLGFEVDNTMTMEVSFPSLRYGDREPGRLRQTQDALLESVENIPGIKAASYAWPVSFRGRGLEVPYSERPTAGAAWADFVAARSMVSPGFFETVGARILNGRSFTASDVDLAAAVEDQDESAAGDAVARASVVVDEIVAEKLFPDANAVGRTIWLGEGTSNKSSPYEIIGVVEHIRHDSIVGSEREAVYVTGVSKMDIGLVVRTTGDPRALLAPIESRLRDLDSEAALFEARTFAEAVDEQLAAPRFAASLALAFAVLALGLAAVGLYGVVAYSVSQRTHDIGVRVALGAGRREILRLVLGEGMTLVIPGILLGAAAAFAVSRVISSLLYGVTPTDVTSFLMVGALLTIVTGLASYVPARRATRVDPLDALRFG